MDPVFGQVIEIGDRVYIDFGDSVNAPPETTATVEDISDDGIRVNGEWHTWTSMAHIEVEL